MKGLRIGQRASRKRCFSGDDIRAYRTLTGDQQLAYGRPQWDHVVPGPLIAGIFSDLLGTTLPGRGTNWLKQRLTFLNSGRRDEELTATVEITRLRPEKQLVNLSTTCVNASGEMICTGEALVLVSDLRAKDTTS